MSCKGKTWAFASTIAAMEELKDKKLCRWNSGLQSLCNPHVNNNVEPFSSSTSYAKTETKRRSKEQNLKQPEESLRIVMYLSCWGPNS
ncbi:Wound-responsive family protein [Parasponia andersonii]|uniref:Wound-responsive family protein n=1 Tax=Parasponia andersonii TaxID=3476 RepID=A0A2P5E4V7_PARAD|nr:Wound-responsive family protein [Parasponia andersonii]